MRHAAAVALVALAGIAGVHRNPVLLDRSVAILVVEMTRGARNRLLFRSVRQLTGGKPG
jgi:hypothetical protein